MLDCQNDGTILVYDPMGVTPISDAVTARGYVPVTTTTATDFNNAFDAGGFDAIFVDAPGAMDAGVKTRIMSWVDGGGRAIVYAADEVDGDAAFAASLGVASIGTGGTGPVSSAAFDGNDLFALTETLPPLAPPVFIFTTVEMVAAAAGAMAATFNSGNGAIFLTNHEPHHRQRILRFRHRSVPRRLGAGRDRR